MTVERTLKDDGRYLLYYSWPTDDAERPEPEPDQASDDDV